MTIEKVDKLEIRIEEQKMLNPGSRFVVLIKSENKDDLKIITTNRKPIVKHTVATENIVKDKIDNKNQ